MSNPFTIQPKPLNLKPLILAKFFYQKGITSHLFIQKLIYFTFLAGLQDNLLLFPEKFQAWKHGPVLVSVFEEVTGCSDLEPMFQKVPSLTHPETISILESIHQEYQDWEVWDLVDKSHQGPWEKARTNLNPEDTSTNELDLKELIKFANALRPATKKE